MMGAMKMMVVASVEVVAASVGESTIMPPGRLVEEDLQMGEELEGLVEKEATAAPVVESENILPEVEGETAALKEIMKGAESLFMEEAPPVEAEAEVVAGAVTGFAKEKGEEILVEVEMAAKVAEATPEPAIVLEEVEVTSMLKLMREVVETHYQEAVTEETITALVRKEPDSAAAQEEEPAEDSALYGEEASLAQEPAAATAVQAALVDSLPVPEVEQGEASTTIPALAAASSSTLPELNLEPTVTAVAEEKSEATVCCALEATAETEAVAEAAAPSEEKTTPPSGLEAQVAEELVAGEESALESSPLAEQHQTSVLEDTQEVESLTEEVEQASVLDETAAHISIVTGLPEALEQISQEMKGKGLR